MEHEKVSNQQLQHETDHEESPTRIYVASLSDYNDGRLHGRWLDADQGAETLSAAVNRMLTSSPMPGAEEFAIHDYEGFGPIRLDEYEPLETVSRLARGIAEHGEAFAHWVALNDMRDELAFQQFEDAYLGCFESLEAYAQELLDDLGYEDSFEAVVPGFLQPYVKIDVEGFARDLELSGDVATARGRDGVYVYDMRG